MRLLGIRKFLEMWEWSLRWVRFGDRSWPGYNVIESSLQSRVARSPMDRGRQWDCQIQAGNSWIQGKIVTSVEDNTTKFTKHPFSPGELNSVVWIWAIIPEVPQVPPGGWQRYSKAAVFSRQLISGDLQGPLREWQNYCDYSSKTETFHL